MGPETPHLVLGETKWSAYGPRDSSFPDGFTTDFRVYRNGELVAQTPHRANGTLTTTPDDAEYRVEYDFADNAPWARLSTRTTTFLDVAFGAHLDRHRTTTSQVEYSARSRCV
ncbi:hypothetical protein [Actinomadura chokoriensis]|uniref:hypothetical protein n=1 Tax=Actinomadura chokoriensis TaxID=454156 RepID=UPI0031F9C181